MPEIHLNELLLNYAGGPVGIMLCIISGQLHAAVALVRFGGTLAQVHCVGEGAVPIWWRSMHV
jgi:hypothetical protein